MGTRQRGPAITVERGSGMRVKCPKCQTILCFEDSQAGGIEVCPDCGLKFRLPSRGPGPDLQRDVRSAAAAPPSPRQPPREEALQAPKPPAVPARPSWQEDDETSPYSLHKETEPSARAVPTRRRPSRREEEDAAYVEEEAYQRERGSLERRRKKRRKSASRGRIAGLSAFWALVLGGGLFWLVLVGLGVFVGIVPLVLATALTWVVAMVGFIWFVVVAFQESVGTGLLVLFVPFYSLYFVVTRWEYAGRPFLLNLVGALLLGVSCVLTGIRLHQSQEASKRREAPVVEPLRIPRGPGGPQRFERGVDF